MVVVDVVVVMVRPMVVRRLPRGGTMHDMLMSMGVRSCVRHMICALSFPLPLTIKVSLHTLAIRSFPLGHDLGHALPLPDIGLPVHAFRLFRVRWWS